MDPNVGIGTRTDTDTSGMVLTLVSVPPPRSVVGNLPPLHERIHISVPTLLLSHLALHALLCSVVVQSWQSERGMCRRGLMRSPLMLERQAECRLGVISLR